MPPEDNDGWKDWSKHVLYQLEDLKKEVASNKALSEKLHDDLLVLQTRTAMISAGASIVVSAIVALIVKHLGR